MKIQINKIDGFNVDIEPKEISQSEELIKDINVQYTMFHKESKLIGNFSVSETAKMHIQNIISSEIEAHLKNMADGL